MVGIDRGVAVSAALSTGELLQAPRLTEAESKRLKVLQQRLARAQRGSRRRARTKRAIAKLRSHEADRRKDWVEKVTTDIARRFDTICIEALDVRAMTRSARGTVEQPGQRVAQKRGLNRSIRRSGGVCSPRACNTKPVVGSSRSRLRTRRNDAAHAGTSLRETARAKRSSSAKTAMRGRATPT